MTSGAGTTSAGTTATGTGATGTMGGGATGTGATSPGAMTGTGNTVITSPGTTVTTTTTTTAPTDEQRRRAAAQTTTTTSRPADYSATYASNSPYVDTETYPNKGMLGSGATLLALSYAPAAITAAVGDREGDNVLYYPVAGPWMYIKREDTDRTGKALLAADGILQGLGALHVLLSFVIPQTESRRWYGYGMNNRFNLMPRLAKERTNDGKASSFEAGLAAAGRF